MTEDRLQRRLSALISADVVDYSRLMAEDQIDTIRSLKACRDRITAAVLKFDGRVIDFVGDNMLGTACIVLVLFLGPMQIKITNSKTRTMFLFRY